MSDRGIVADASAILALLQNEPFTRADPEQLVGASISAVNFSEVVEKLLSAGRPEPAVDTAVAALDLQVIAFDEAQARAAARLRPATRRAGLSLADRACLALGMSLGRPAVTADRSWADLDIGVEIVLIR